MTHVENPRENTCFGCGPEHPRGLRLSFEQVTADDGVKEVRTRFSPTSEETGWPTLFHHGLHFTVLYETSYWTALTLGGELWTSFGPHQYTIVRLPRVGSAYEARGRIVRSGPEELTILATTAAAAGKPCGRLETTWRPARREALERAGIVLPAYLAQELSP